MQYLVYIAAVVSVIGLLPYLRGIFQGKVQPNRVSWLLWSLAPMIGFFAALSKDGFTTAEIPVFVAGFTPLLVFICSFLVKNSAWEIERLDWLCAALSILALIIWALTKEPNLAIFFSILADGFAALPTLIKAWKFPHTEKLSPYMTGIITPFPALLSVTMLNFSQLAFPVYLVFINFLISSAIIRGNIEKKNGKF